MELRNPTPTELEESSEYLKSSKSTKNAAVINKYFQCRDLSLYCTREEPYGKRGYRSRILLPSNGFTIRPVVLMITM
jgi:hypothetical protein